MTYQLEHVIARRAVLKGAGFAALCSAAVPLQVLMQHQGFPSILNRNSSEMNPETGRSTTPNQNAKCPSCHAIHSMKQIRLTLSDRCQSCGSSLLG